MLPNSKMKVHPMMAIEIRSKFLVLFVDIFWYIGLISVCLNHINKMWEAR